jgi:hypothetical protein
MMKNKIVIFVCGAMDYHSMDWFHEVKSIAIECEVFLATDIVGDRNASDLTNSGDKVVKLFDINKFLLKRQSRIADIWRNFVKLASTPIQIIELRKLKKQYPEALFHAHSMYYIFLCWYARLKFIATPMGSDVLVRPDKSKLYRYMTKRSLQAAYLITVDSLKMKEKVKELSGRDSELIQNGIDVRMITSYINNEALRKGLVSIRGFYPNYQIEKLMDAREQSNSHPAITFIYPFYEEEYRKSIQKKMQKEDKDLGLLPKQELYKLLAGTLLVVSIPESDSSPRSVYESIFCGCCVAVSYSPWIHTMPACMQARIILVNLDEKGWLDNALNSAKEITKKPYLPSQEALINYDQYESMKKVCREIYHII